MGSDELVERLRRRHPHILDPISLQPKLVNPDGPEAANHIEALTAQLAEARESERAAMVAWLKSMVTGYPESSAYGHAAFLIEAGEHLT